MVPPPKKDKNGVAHPHDPDKWKKIQADFQGSIVKGQKLFKAKCAQCHACEPGAKQGQGPNLHGMFGRKAGTVPGYQYSTAQETSGIVWNEAFLVEYLYKPKEYVPGTKMIFGGLKKDKEISDLVTYMVDACGK